MSMIRAGSLSLGTQLTNVTITSPTNFGDLFGLLSDKKTLLISESGWNSNVIGLSSDGGQTITWGHAFDAGASYSIKGFIETPGGEILISTGQKGSTAVVGNVYRSTGWNKATASATSWQLVTSTIGTGVSYDGRWGFNERCVVREGSLAGAIVIAEYGTHISEALSAGNTAEDAAVKVKISYDDGKTWTVIFDLAQFYNNANAMLHLHGCCIDNEFQRVMVVYGDGGNNDVGECAIIYCNFEDLTNPVWTVVPGTRNRNPRQTQCTNIFCSPTRIELISDSTDGAIRVINRKGYRTYGQLTDVANLPTGIIGANIFTDQSNPDGIRLFTYQFNGSNLGYKPAIFAVTDGAINEIYRATTGQTQGRGIVNAVGPDVNGNIYAGIQLSGTTQLLSGNYAP